MKRLFTALVVAELMLPLGVYQPEARADPLPAHEFLDLNNSQVPPGWTQELRWVGPGVQDERFWARVVDGEARLKRTGTLPAGATAIRLEYDGNIAYSYWGLINGAGIRLSVDSFGVYDAVAEYNWGLVNKVRVIRYPVGSLYDENYPLEYADYHYTAIFSEGQIRYKGTKILDGQVLFDVLVNEPALHLSDVQEVFFYAHTTTINDCWMDNLQLTVIGGEEICDAFITPQHVRLRCVLSLDRVPFQDPLTPWRRPHSFMIHLQPCEPMDVSTGDSAEVFVDVDGSGAFDPDERYPAVVSGVNVDGVAPDIAIKVFVECDLIDNDPHVAIYAVGGVNLVDNEGNPIDYLQVDTFDPGAGNEAALERQETKPATVTLYDNVPNPFNPITSIRFYLPEPAEASLEVYNVLGEKVATLVNGHLEAEKHVVSWDATDSDGSDLPSGIYFSRLTVNGQPQTRKMVLVR